MLSNARVLETTNEVSLKLRAPLAGFPVSGDDPQHQFTLGIKQNAEFDAFDLNCGQFSLHFQKGMVPPEASLLENSQRHYNAYPPTCMLTEKQVAFVLDVLKTRTKKIPLKQNPKFSGHPGDIEPEYLAEKIVTVGEWVVIQKASEYNPLAEYREISVPRPEPDEAEKMGDQIYQAQGKKRK